MSPSSVSSGEDPDVLLQDVLEFPLFDALAGRRSRRFGRGMSLPPGPVSYDSTNPPLPLSPLENALLIQAGLGVTGWHFGIPYSEAEPGFSSYSNRFTGRTAPSAAGIGTPEMFYTDDDGVYMVQTRDPDPDAPTVDDAASRAQRVVEAADRNTRQLRDTRLSLPREAPHMSAHNHWNANVDGSSDYFPVGDVSEQSMSLIAIMGRTGFALYDDVNGCFAGDLERFFDAGFLNRENKLPLSVLEQYALATVAMELAMIGENMVLTLQAIGLGGWFFTGMHPLSVMGAFAEDGIPGLGFRFQRDDAWAVPNPVGLDGHYETYSPPYHGDMRDAARALVEHKFGDGGTYDPEEPNAYRDGEDVMRTVEEYPEPFVDYLGETCQYVFDTFGKFPGTVPTVFMRPIVQAHHLELEYYDRYIGPGSYLPTHAEHMARWHGASD